MLLGRVVALQRLRPALEINDGKAPVTEPRVIEANQALAVGTAVGDPVKHGLGIVRL